LHLYAEESIIGVQTECGADMGLDYEWHDLVGNLGVLLIIASYFWLQLGRISGQSIVYSAINACGAALVLTSLYFEFNFSAALVEFFWLAISLMGVVMNLKKVTNDPA
jgi:hypothetical protein